MLFCLPATPFLCLALSTGSDLSPSPILPIQVKNVSKIFNNDKDLFSKADWIIQNETLFSTYNLDSPVSRLVGGGVGISTRRGLRVLFENNTLRMGRNKECITILKCKRRLRGGFCDFDTVNPVENVFQITKGAYVELLPCSPLLSVAQTFVKYEHGSCTMELLNNTVCDEPCNLAPFIYDQNYCPQPSYPSPTASPTFSYPSLSPSTSPSPPPSASPSRNSPSFSPQHSPTTTDTPTTTVTNDDDDEDYYPPYWAFVFIPVGILAGVLVYMYVRKGKSGR